MLFVCVIPFNLLLWTKPQIFLICIDTSLQNHILKFECHEENDKQNFSFLNGDERGNPRLPPTIHVFQRFVEVKL